MDRDLLERFERAIREDGRYAPEAFEFLHRGLALAARIKYGHNPRPRPATPDGAGAAEQPQHVTGQELCQALRVQALERWGPLAREVLRRWNIHCTRDFGEMVYLMIGLSMMGKQHSDDISDFDDVYDFATAFSAYQIELDADRDEGASD